ncbi:hypothetical protein Tco_0850057 [Tanacetum coccineum]
MEIRQFLGLVGYYRRFIEGFLKIAKLMTKLTQKKVMFIWGDKQEATFQLLKQKLCSAPILALPEGSKDFIAYCGASIKGPTSGIRATKGTLHKIEHRSKPFIPPNQVVMSANDNFSLHDDEELSLHDDASLDGSVPASNKGDAPAKPPQIITTNTLSNIKLPVLQKDDYDTWAMEMEHYLEYIDNEEEQFADEKERKARTLLLMAFPKDHLKTFSWHGYSKRSGQPSMPRKAWRKGMIVPKNFYHHWMPFGAGVQIHDNETKKKFDTAVIDDLYNRSECPFEQDIQKTSLLPFHSLIMVAFLSQAKTLPQSISQIAMPCHKDKKFLQKTADGQRVDGKKCMGIDKRKVAMFSIPTILRHFARETDAGYNDIPLYSRFKQVEYKGVPHPLSGDYTPREQEDIDDSLYEYGKHGPQPKSPSPTESNASSIVFSICPSNDSDGELGTVSNANSTVYSSCQSNDSDGEQGTVSDHSVHDDPTNIPSIEQVTIVTQKTQPQVPKPQQTVDPSCAQHVKTPRQPIRTPVTPSPIPSYNRQNWNQRMERDLGAGYSFQRKPCFVCGSLSHLIKNCDYYEKKMAREAAFKSKRVVNTNDRQATPAWNNTNRINKANQFTPRPVNVRPNLSTASNTIKTGRVNVNTGHGNVNSDR